MDLADGQWLFRASAQARSGDVAAYFAQLAAHYQQRGYRQLDVFLDRNPTHKDRMRAQLAGLLAQAGTTLRVRFHLLAAYSPQLNLVEYVIHLLRHKALHRSPHYLSLAELQQQVAQCCAQPQFLPYAQLLNLMDYLDSLVSQ